ncbi:succinate dehydrogenase, cytochrome b556 subunit [Pseudomonadota bacterium]|jgi:succinate dehydrogenase / fumarate reductase cytochrome b subunit|nr:succinate dehydrogenase, cytochrome b556 subunit [Xanthomonadales bacterium]
MKAKQRPLSPFMIGPYYKPQMTSLMSIAHRLSGVFLSLLGAPLLLWWIMAVGAGPEAYGSLLAFFGGLLGRLLLAASMLALFYHLFNGIRHLVWDSGRALDIRSAYTAGWLVLIATVLATAVMLGRLL